MLTQLRFQNFKSWRDTGQVRLAPLTGLFGPNSSGKTSLLQFLLLQKQTVESLDRSRVLHTGDERTYVNLGTFQDLVYNHQLPGTMSFEVSWVLPNPLQLPNLEEEQSAPLIIDALDFQAEITGTPDNIWVDRFIYTLTGYQIGMERIGSSKAGLPDTYSLITKDHHKEYDSTGQGFSFAPFKNYIFPAGIKVVYPNLEFLAKLALSLEQQFQNIFYLGPLREYPSRTYIWGGERPQDVGQRGELAIPALLASQFGKSSKQNGGRPDQTIEERVATWLQELGLIHSFSLQRIAENREVYEVRIRRAPDAAEVLITEVGFGVSQILPVLVLCYYVPQGATVILEQPEIHLHPSVQAGLADMFIDVIKTRNIQIILESHSEHLLRRLQRRIAEEQLPVDQAALYFASSQDGESKLEELQLDPYGNITNWPHNFFGDELGELAAMTEAAMRRTQFDQHQSQ
jgi:hypothetical protein